jgi:hypothetical protein
MTGKIGMTKKYPMKNMDANPLPIIVICFFIKHPFIVENSGEFRAYSRMRTGYNSLFGRLSESKP